MKANAIPVTDVESYIAGFPVETQALLQKVRKTIHKAVPKAEETISYQMPAYKFHGVLAYFAGYKHHIGFYPTALGISAFKKELAGYKGAKGSVQFPLDQPIPYPLIAKIVAFRAKTNLEKSALKTKSKK